MKEVHADSANKTGKRGSTAHKPAASDSAANKERANALQRCYGKIGISAVAAAAQYQGAAKNPAYAPAPTKPSHEAGDAA